MSSSPVKKTHCYKSVCKVVRTGFQWNDWAVCKTCGEEVTETLATRIEEDTKREEERKKSDSTSNKEDDSDYMGMLYGYTDPFGD